MKRQRLSRRDFLKLVGATGVVAPSLIGLNLLYESRGELPGGHDPFKDARSLHSEFSGNQPILVLNNDSDANPFGAYLGEILLAEGVNSFDLVNLSVMDFGNLSKYEIVLLSGGALNQEYAKRISEYVFAGGNLIAIYPDPRLTSFLGLKTQEKENDQHYIVVDSAHQLAKGLNLTSLQYHGPADFYLLDGASPIAWFCDKDGGAKNNPAVSINKYGNGWACAWAYDLTKSIILTRQGNPNWADQERDNFDGVRPSDMFKGWLDLDRIEIPQADEQQRLLINVLNFMIEDKYPLPRLWYFPGTSKCMLIATSDAHQNPASAFEAVVSHVEKYEGYISFYSLPPFYTVPYRAAQKVRWWLEEMSIMDEAYFPSPSRVAKWRERGHEFGIHPLVERGFDAGWEESWEFFTGVGYGPVSPTTRVHRILWDGWVESARSQAEYGFRMNLDYYHVGNAFQKETGEWVYGHFTGSGLAMKFVDENGKILNIYQQLTHLADDHLLNLHWGGSVKLPAAVAVDVSRKLIDRSLDGGYAALGAIFHTDPFAAGEQWAMEEGEWMDGTLEYAVTKNVPIWSSEMWLDFVEARHDAVMGAISWSQDGTVLKFKIDVPNFRSGTMSMLLPLENAGQRLSGLEINGQQTDHLSHVLGCTTYAWFNLFPGKNAVEAFYRIK